MKHMFFFFFLYNPCLKHSLPWENFNEISYIYIGLNTRYPLFLPSELNFLYRLSKYIRISNFMKTGKTEFFHADRHCRSKLSLFGIFFERADSHVKLLKLADVSETKSTHMIRDLILLDNRATRIVYQYHAASYHMSRSINEISHITHPIMQTGSVSEKLVDLSEFTLFSAPDDLIYITLSVNASTRFLLRRNF